MSGVFKFKQFNVDQTGCAMKINTDGVLLGALADAADPGTILDIGTGTGVIALMLAQRFQNAKIDAVEIDAQAAQTAARNFENSPFAEKLQLFPVGFEEFFDKYHEKKYDLIISNPPFYINSLRSPEAKRELAKHADHDFFEKLIDSVSKHLSANGLFCLILPIDTAELKKTLVVDAKLFCKKIISVYSYPDSEPHREILAISLSEFETEKMRFVIYDSPKRYSATYQETLKDFFTIF